MTEQAKSQMGLPSSYIRDRLVALPDQLFRPDQRINVPAIYSERFDLSAVQLGWLGSIFFFGYSLAQFLAGYLADRIGPKRTMTIAIWVFTLATGLTGFVRTFGQFIVLRLGLAVGEGHHFAPALRLIANWFPREEKARANGFFSTTWAVAPAVVPIVATQAAAGLFHGAWRPFFFVLAVPGFFGVFILWKWIQDSPKAMYEKGRSARRNTI